MTNFSTGDAIQRHLEALDVQLAHAQNAAEDAARGWFKEGKPAREVAEMKAYASATGTTIGRKLAADAAGAQVGCDQEARWESLIRVIRIIETRVTIAQSVLKSMGRS